MEIKNLLKNVYAEASKRGWRLVKVSEANFVVIFDRIKDEDRVQMCIYWSKRTQLHNPLFTVSTSMNHPKKGKTQLHRKGVGMELLGQLLDNPRKHTGSGYYEK